MDVENRPPPAKKRRFFVEDPSSPEGDARSESLVDGNGDAKHNEESTRDHVDAINADGNSNEPVTFNAELLESFVGEKLSPDTVSRLRELSSDNIERGIMEMCIAVA